MGTKVSRITGLADDIKLNMAAADIRIEAPIRARQQWELKYLTTAEIQCI